jgi:tellurite resistance protein
MASEPARFRPKIFPPPEFPPRKSARFARMPPAVFPVILGSLGLVLALRRGLDVLGLPLALADLLAGLALALWGFAAFAYLAKLARRPGVIWEDLKVLPGRAGLAAATAGMLGVAALLVPYAPGLARVVLFAGLATHGLLALAMIRALRASPPDGRVVTPAWHLAFVGFIIGGLAALPLGLEVVAKAVFWGTLPVAAVIWGISLWQIVTRVPPAPLRPLLAIHVAPAALFSLVSGGLGMPMLAMGFALAGLALLVVLLTFGRWLTEAGFSALWGAFTFPLAALASALLALDGAFLWTGVTLLVAALGLVPMVLWRILKMWGGGALAAKTNAAEA